MAKTILTVIISFFIFACGSTEDGESLRAKTQDGRTVILHADGSWTFLKKEAPVPVAPDAPKDNRVNAPKRASKKVSDPRGLVELWYAPGKWTAYPKPERLSPDASFALIHKTKDAYALGIIERISMPLETLKKIAVDNAKNVAPDAEVVLDEERQINGSTASIMGITGTIDGIPFRYHSFYWTGEKGSVQVITYTSQNLFAEYHDDFNDLLSGIVLNQ
jgi:hypothetical protein